MRKGEKKEKIQKRAKKKGIAREKIRTNAKI